MRLQLRGALLSHRLRGEGGGEATKGGWPTGRIYNSPLNQPALWAEPIGQCVST